MQITEKLRAKILLSLPKGYAKSVAAKCGVTDLTVYRVLHHGQSNQKVAEALISLAAENKAKLARDHNRLKKLTKQL